jgi:hypothetical protein
LIWALKELRHSDKLYFTTSELWKKIRLAPDFPQEQILALGQRITKSDLITIAPEMGLAAAKERLDSETETQVAGDGNTAYLELSFQFDSPITEQVFKETAEVLHELVADRRLSARRIAFLRKYDEPRAPRLRGLVQKYMASVGKRPLEMILPDTPKSGVYDQEEPQDAVIDELSADAPSTQEDDLRPVKRRKSKRSKLKQSKLR